MNDIFAKDLISQDNKHSALIIIDLQNDYFPNGKFPLANTQETLTNVQSLLEYAKQENMKIILIQHIADKSLGLAPFFNQDTPGAEIHSAILNAAPDADIIIKHFADSFEQTALKMVLDKAHIKTIYLCGMMTQNCVTHTALSKHAEKYELAVIADACTSVDNMIHQIALHAMSPRIKLISTNDFLQ